MKIQILNRWSLAVIFEAEVDTNNRRVALGIAVKLALKKSADLTYADLTDADLTDANLTDANLTRANLTRANLTYADLTRANIDSIKYDMWAVLAHAPLEVPGLIESLKSGSVDGSTYCDDGCGCLVGTLALKSGANPDASSCSVVRGLHGNPSRPIEIFFMGIKPCVSARSRVG